MIARIEKHPIIALFACTILMLGFSIYLLPVSIMEARNFVSAREMLTDNNWLLTTFNGEPRYQKPALPTWITAFFGFIFGYQSIWALRLPAVLMVFASALGTYSISKVFFKTKTSAFIVALVTLTSLYVVAILFEAPWDIYAHGFMILAIYGLFLMLKNKSMSIIPAIVFVLCFASSILSKGPVSLYVLFLPFLISFGIVYGYRMQWKFILKIFLLLVIALVIGSSWYIYVRLEDAESFSAIAIEETQRWKSYETKPFYYYWSFFIQSGLWTLIALVSLLYPYMKSRVKNLEAYKMTLFWTLIAVVFLSLIPTKKSRYVMPILLPLALTVGFYLNFQIKNFKKIKSNFSRSPIYITFGVMGIVGVLLPIISLFILNEFNPQTIILLSLAASVFWYLSFLIYKNLKRKNIKRSFYAVIAIYVCLGFFAVALSRPLIKQNFETIEELNNPDFNLYYLGYVTPEQIFYNCNTIPNLLNNFEDIIENNETIFVFTQNSDLSKIDEIQTHFEISLYKTYDFNIKPANTSGYNTRLHQKLYKLVPKL